MSFEYRAMIYFAVATMHLYRKDIDLDASDFRRKNGEVLARVHQEGKNLFGYELSWEQMDRAIAAYIAPAQSTKDTEAAR